MREGFNNKVLVNTKGELFGIALGSDFCAEHEWGIKGLNDKFGIAKENKPYFHNTKITKSPIHYKEGKEYSIISSEVIRDNWEGIQTKNYKPKELYTSWDGNDFCIISKDKEKLKTLYNEFLRLNVTFAFYNGKFIENPSLSILIVDKTPKGFVDIYNNEIDKHNRLNNELLVNGFAELIYNNFTSKPSENINKRYAMALSPAFSKGKIPNSKYNFWFWLNYADNKDYGWFRAEDVKEWLQTPKSKLTLKQIQDKNLPKYEFERTTNGHKIPKKVRQLLKSKTNNK